MYVPAVPRQRVGMGPGTGLAFLLMARGFDRLPFDQWSDSPARGQGGCHPLVKWQARAPLRGRGCSPAGMVTQAQGG